MKTQAVIILEEKIMALEVLTLNQQIDLMNYRDLVGRLRKEVGKSKVDKEREHQFVFWSIYDDYHHNFRN